MEKQVNVKIVLGTMCAVMIIMLSVAFAHFSRMLKTAGQGKVDPANFDIHFKNLSEPVLHGGAEVTGTPTIANEGAKINNIAVTLKLPGDYVLYTVDIENSGDINTEVSNINHTNLDNSLLELEVYYTSAEERVQTGDELFPGEIKSITIKIKYKDIENPDLLPDEVQRIDFSYSVTYTQSNKSYYSESGLPRTYEKLEYLESNGTQYIDTGILNSSENRVYVKFMQTVSGVNRIIGERNTSSSAMFMVVDGAYSGYFKYGNQEYDPSTTLSPNIMRIWEIDKNKLYLDETLVKTFNKQTFSTSKSLYLFGNNGAAVGSNLKIYECKIYTNDVLVRDFIPSLDPHGRPCMYDTVTHTPFYNQGTGEFKYYYYYDYSNEETYANGLPKIFTELEYLEAARTTPSNAGTLSAYINTGVTNSSENRVYVKFMQTASGINRIVGERNTSSKSMFMVVDATNSGYFKYGSQEYDPSETLSQNIMRTWDFNKNKVYLDGALVKTFNEQSFSTSNSLYLFANNGVSGGSNLRIYECKIYTNDVLVRNFIPALDKYGRPCMYDTVSMQPFYSANSEQFSYGLKE